MQRLSPNQTLFHWSPMKVRESILWNGLLIRQRNIHHVTFDEVDDGWRAPWICAGVTPLDAWRFLNGAKGVHYDLWQFARIPEDKVRCRKDGGKEIIEVRIHNYIHPNRLFYVGTREYNNRRRF